MMTSELSRTSQIAMPLFIILFVVVLALRREDIRVYAQSASECADRFIEHTLPHLTRTRGSAVRFYESNGSGLAISDLDDDGLLDIVMGNLNGDNQILWNRGALRFTAETMPRPSGRTRAVQAVDVDADGLLDIVLTTQTSVPQFWRNEGERRFTLSTLEGVTYPAYTIQWMDADADGDLDLFTGSYNAELMQLLRDSFLFSDGAGVIAYENRGGVFIPTRLSEDSQALALWVGDLNTDGDMDFVVGNDFSLPDQSWTLRNGVWMPIDLLPVTTYSTMSFDMGDIDNDGTQEFFAADMRPMSDDAETLEQWRYVIEDLARDPRVPGDRQVSENVLLQQAGGAFINAADGFGVGATGWSWSAKFGDLNQDGFLDLYVVNGMTAVELFGHLPNDALIEPNYAFRGDGERFIAAPEWGLGSLADGRGMSMGDLDNDGDLDIVVNNLNAPAQLFENDLCGGDSLQVELRWMNSPNPFGVGTQLALHTSSGIYTRDMRAGSGYLSGDPMRVHFGYPAGSQVYSLDVYWTDGAHSTIDALESSPVIRINR